MKNVLNAVCTSMKKCFAAIAAYLRSLKNDTSKLILALILVVAVLLTCAAVVTFTTKVVSGISGLFAGDEAVQEEDVLPVTDTATEPEPCATCMDGICKLCNGGTLDCPDCENGLCPACQRECLTCGGTMVIDCEACTDGICNTCVPPATPAEAPSDATPEAPAE